MGKSQLLSRRANLNKFPARLPHEQQQQHLALGDLHGNALKLIYILVEEGILEVDSDQYVQLHHIYMKNLGNFTMYPGNMEPLNHGDIQAFESIIKGATVHTGRSLTLIGDLLADRGNNDYFTLLVLERLHQSTLDFEILLSNHDVELIQDYELHDLSGDHELQTDQGRSLVNMVQLFNHGWISKERVQQIIEESYKPHLKAISYSVSKEGDITLFTHAPIGLETLKDLAKLLDIDYQDEHLEQLIETLETMNAKIGDFLTKNQLSQLLRNEYEKSQEPRLYHLGLSTGFLDSKNFPLTRIIWNRSLKHELVTEPQGNRYEIRFVHGHIGQGSVDGSHQHKDKYGQIYCTHQNLDNNFGKSPQDFKTNQARSSRLNGLFQTNLPAQAAHPTIVHFTRQSSELSAQQYQTLCTESNLEVLFPKTRHLMRKLMRLSREISSFPSVSRRKKALWERVDLLKMRFQQMLRDFHSEEQRHATEDLSPELYQSLLSADDELTHMLHDVKFHIALDNIKNQSKKMCTQIAGHAASKHTAEMSHRLMDALKEAGENYFREPPSKASAEALQIKLANIVDGIESKLKQNAGWHALHREIRAISSLFRTLVFTRQLKEDCQSFKPGKSC